MAIGGEPAPLEDQGFTGAGTVHRPRDGATERHFEKIRWRCLYRAGADRVFLGRVAARVVVTKAGNKSGAPVLIEAARQDRHCAGEPCNHGQPDEVVSHAWRAQQRLHRRYRYLVDDGKRTPVAVAAATRELVGLSTREPTPSRVSVVTEPSGS